MLGHLIPSLFVVLFLYGILSEVKYSKEFRERRTQREQIRKEAGYLGQCTTYKIINDSIFYKGMYFEGDQSTFKLVNCHYARDMVSVYAKNTIATYVLSQELKLHNVGGNNVYDPNDVAASILGLVVVNLMLIRFGFIAQRPNVVLTERPSNRG